MSTQNVTDPGAGQAVPSLANRGNDEFADILGGDNGKDSGSNGTTETTETVQQGTSEKPELTKTTLQRAADDKGTTKQTSTETTSAQQVQQVQQTVAPGLDKTVLDQIVETATRAATSAADARTTQQAASQVKKDQREMTAEEFNAKYQIPEINEATIQAILDADPKKGAAMLRNILIRNMGSAVLMAKDVIDKQLGSFREEMNPHVQSWNKFQKEQRETALENQFYTTYSDLANEKPLVKEMQDAIFGRIASGQLKPFDKPEDALKAVAAASRAVLTRMGKVSGTGGASNQQSQQQSQGQRTHTRQMTAASTAGQSGTGRAAGKSDEETIFGPDFV